MKYGILFNKNNKNIGDDIQAYATARFLPHIDYFIDRESINSFTPEKGEPVAVIMNAWYMWKKWNWPPSEYIIPKMSGFHYADHQLANQWYGTPIKYEFLTGSGGEYLKTWGPVGCRDMFTLRHLQELGIDSYFSGCITMTLPKMPELPNKDSYICLVDVNKKAAEKISDKISDSGLEIKSMTHLMERNSETNWDERCRKVEELLTIYQNARCVVTRRLHCALPCLAMGVPVLLVRGGEDDTRFEPYYDYLHFSRAEDIIEGNYSYDFVNPPKNSDAFKACSDRLRLDIEKFISEVESAKDAESLKRKLPYSDTELIKWRHDVMRDMLEKWFENDHERHALDVERNKEIRLLKKELAKRDKSIARLKEKTQEKNERIRGLKKELKATTSELEAIKNESLIERFKRKLSSSK